MNIILLTPEEVNLHTKRAYIHHPKHVHHIKTVLQAQVGDCLKIGMLGGKMGSALIESIGDVVCLNECLLDKSPPAKLDLTVVFALPRPKVLRRMVVDMTAMGVAQMVIVNSARTDKSYWQSPILQKMDEFIQEGLEQGVDTIVPKIHLAKRFRPFVEDELVLYQGAKWVAHPYAGQCIGQMTYLPKVLIVGAEGGFVPFEIDLLESLGVVSVSMGQRILRSESAINVLVGHWLIQSSI